MGRLSPGEWSVEEGKHLTKKEVNRMKKAPDG
jgi:hypothetical protein